MDIYGDCSQTTTIDGGGATQIFNITNSGNVSFNFLTLQNGSGMGSAIRAANAGVATFSVGINNSLIQNSASGRAVVVSGVAVGQEINLAVNNSSFLSNRYGALYIGLAPNEYVNSTITNSTFSSNSTASPGDAGAITFGAETLTITGSLFSDNSSTSTGAAGALEYSSLTLAPSIVLTNDTFFSNSDLAAGGAGAIGESSGSGGPSLNITNCTFANNSGGAVGSIFQSNGTLSNTLFFGNSTNCGGPKVPASQGGNLSDQPSTDCNLSQLSDTATTSAALGPLQDNGGPTQTVALLSSSAGIDTAVANSCPNNDQRGLPRLVDGKCDGGAFELSP
jgi:hypothetical protein